MVVHFARTNLLHGHVHSIDKRFPICWGIRRSHGCGESFFPGTWRLRTTALDDDPVSRYHLEFEDGVEAWTIPAGHWEFEVMGSEGAIRSRNNGVGWELRKVEPAQGRRPSVEAAAFPEVEPRSAVVACLEDLVAAHESGEPSLGNVEVTHHVTEACFAVAESHRRDGGTVRAARKWIEVCTFFMYERRAAPIPERGTMKIMPLISPDEFVGLDGINPSLHGRRKPVAEGAGVGLYRIRAPQRRRIRRAGRDL